MADGRDIGTPRAAAGRPPGGLRLEYPGNLPVCARREEIRRLVAENQVVVVCGSTGSGKTTQLPKILLEAGCAAHGRIGVTQPRRLAATGMARRVAEEMRTGLGEGVGYQVRFDDRTGEATLVKFMTDGILLAETRRDRLLRQYGALVIDEAHERSLNIDFLLGYLRNLLPSRPDLRIVVSSATLDAEGFAAFFNNAPVVAVEGRVFPIEDLFLPPGPDEELANHLLRAVRWISEIDPRGDILAFLPGEREIREAAAKLEGQKWGGTEILPLFGRLAMAEQQRVFQPGGRRRIVLATNVAETSITIPGIRYVVDSGQVRLSRYNPRTQVQGLQVEQVSQASARQRRGRCGRTADGICIHLYDRETLEGSPAFTDPEIRRTSLAGVILRMEMLGLPPIDRFPLIDPPQPALVREGYRALRDLGALDARHRLTPAGRDIAAFPLDPHLARMAVQANREGVLPEILVLVAFLSIQDVRERPAEKTDAADLAHRQWADPRSDFSTVLNLWNFLEGERAGGASHGRLRRCCKKNFLNYRRAVEWRNLWQDLGDTARDLGWKPPPHGTLAPWNHDLVHRCLLAGLPANIGVQGENREFRGARGRRFFLFPGSALFKKPPQWVVAFALVETTRLYARTVGEIQPEWLEAVAPHLCKAVYKNPGWNPERGFVQALESIVSGGLTLVQGRRIHYGPVNPAEARAIFIRDALVPGNLNARGEWLERHRRMLADIAALEEKIRRPGALLDTQAIYGHFDRLLSAGVCSVQTLEKWLRAAKPNLVLRMEEAIYPHGAPARMEDYPDELEFFGERFQVVYTFDPGAELDGIALACPTEKLALLPDWAPDWLVPGWLPEKVARLLRSLPKNLRVPLVPLDRTAGAFCRAADGLPAGRPLLDALSAYLQQEFRLPVDASDFDESPLPGFLRMKVVETCDDRIVRVHTAFPGGHRRPDGRASRDAPFAKWVLPCADGWPGDAMPEFVAAGTHPGIKGYPALACGPDGVGRRVFRSPVDAAYVHRAGLARLYRMRHPVPVRQVEKRPPLSPALQLALAAIDGGFLSDLLDAAIIEALTGGGTVPVRDPAAFAARSEAAGALLYAAAADLAGALAELLDLRERIAADLEKLENGAGARHDMELQLQFLFRPGFLQTMGLAGRYRRYLKAMQMRIQRIRSNPQADLRKLEEIAPFLERLSDGLLQCGDIASAYGLVEFALLVEEFRVNRFAPEIKVPLKVSARRLEEAWRELQYV